MQDLREFMDKVTVTDGAWGTQLQAQGLPAGDCGDLWNVEQLVEVAAVAGAYSVAGSKIILTNTFQSNRISLAHWGLADRAAELARAGALVSRMVSDATGDVFVFGSMGPTGKLPMMGDVDEAELADVFKEQAAALAEGGVDAIVCETFGDVREAVIAATAAKRATGLAVVVSMTFDSGPDRGATMMGVTPEKLAEAAKAEAPMIDAVGANCGAGPDNFIKLARRFRAVWDGPIWLKPNAGLPVVREGKTTFPLSPEQFADAGPDLAAAGGNFIGGCCGTTPDHINALAERLKR